MGTTSTNPVASAFNFLFRPTEEIPGRTLDRLAAAPLHRFRRTINREYLHGTFRTFMNMGAMGVSTLSAGAGCASLAISAFSKEIGFGMKPAIATAVVALGVAATFRACSGFKSGVMQRNIAYHASSACAATDKAKVQALYIDISADNTKRQNVLASYHYDIRKSLHDESYRLA